MCIDLRSIYLISVDVETDIKLNLAADGDGVLVSHFIQTE